MKKITRIIAFALSFVLMFNTVALAAGKAQQRGKEHREEMRQEREMRENKREKIKKGNEKEIKKKREEIRKRRENPPKAYSASFDEYELERNERIDMMSSQFAETMALNEEPFEDVTEGYNIYSIDIKEDSTDEDSSNGEMELMSITSDEYSTLTTPSYINNIYAPTVLDNSGDVSVSPYSGDVQINVTDLELPGRNGLDLKLSYFYQSPHAQVEFADASKDYKVAPTTYYNERYALGIGWSFGFPSVEIREADDEDKQQLYYHDGTGRSYRYNKNDEKISDDTVDPPIYNGYQIYSTNLDNYYTDNVIFNAKDKSYKRGDYRSQYSFKTADNTMQYFGKTGEILAIVDRFGNEITFDYENYPGRNLLDFGSVYDFTGSASCWDIRDVGIIFDSEEEKTSTAKSYGVSLDDLYSDYRISFWYEAPEPTEAFKDEFSGAFNVSYELRSGSTVLETVVVAESILPEAVGEALLFQQDITIGDYRDYDETPDNIRLLIEVVDGENEIQFWHFRVSPMRPLISKITDTIGRTLEFYYEGDIYFDYEENGITNPIFVDFCDSEGNLCKTFTYERAKYTMIEREDDYDLEQRFFLLTKTNNEERDITIEYDTSMSGYARSDGYTEKNGYGHRFSGRPLVCEVDFYYYKTLIEYEKTQKRVGNGFTDTWRVSSKYDIDKYQSDWIDKDDVHYNETSYDYERGIYHDETAFNRKEAFDYIEPINGNKYIVDVTDSDGAVHSYAYTMHTFEKGKRLTNRIMLPLLDYETIAEGSDENSDITTVTYEYDEDTLCAINMPNRTVTEETVDGVIRTYINNYEYDDDSCMVYRSTLNLTEDEEDFPEEKTQTVEYKKLSNRLFLPETQSYYQSENGELLNVSIEYDAAGRKVSETNENGETVYYEYDTVFTWLPTRVYYTDPMKIGDENRVVEILYEYTDDYGFGPNVTKVKYADGEYAVTYTYYEPQYGNVVKTIDTNGNETEYMYDYWGRLELIYTPSYLGENGERWLSQSFLYDYEYYGRCIWYSQCTTVEWDGKVEEEYVSDAYYYDGFGNLVEKYDAIDNTYEKNIYDLSNRLVGYQNAVDYDTHVYTMSYTYDGLDRIVSATDKMGNTQSVDYKSLSKEFSFTPVGATVAENHYVETYDIYGNLIKTSTYPEGLDDTESAIVQTYEYDLVGNLLTATDGNENTTSYEYDNIGNPVLVVTPDGKRIETKFSKFGTPAEVTLYNGDESYTIAKTYDDRGLETSTEQKGLDVYTRPWYYEYADDGNISVVTEPNGNRKLYTYDNSFNVIGLDMGSENRSYAYNHLGLADKVTSTVNGVAAQTVDYDYGYKGELYEKTVNGETISYDYNELYNLTSITTPSGHVREYTRDDLQRVTTITADDKEFKYVYNGDGLVKEVIYPTSDIITSYTYDNANQVTSVVTKKGEEVLASYEYEYDKAGNITEISGSENVTYTYDDLYRLSSYTKDGVTVSYEYDGRSNIIAEESSDGNLVTYAYSGDNRLECKTENGVEITYEYDLNGNLISDSTGNRYSYDENNKLVYAKVDGEEVRYTIGLDGLRTSKTTAEGTVEYFVDEGGLVVSENSDQIIWGNRALAKKIGSNYYYYIYNAHGDVVMILDESGNIVNSYSYDPWGVVTDEVETVDNSIKYAGEYYDEETGLIYLRARYYDPSIGRFAQEDRHWNSMNMIYGDENEESNIPNIAAIRQATNGYVYCGNNPIKYIDPAGGNWVDVVRGFFDGIARYFLPKDSGYEYYDEYEDAGDYYVSSWMGSEYAEFVSTHDFVFDVSVSAGNVTVGYSYIQGNASNYTAGYVHVGYGKSVYLMSYGVSFSLGIVNNATKPEDYAGDFVDISAALGIGVEGCGWFSGTNAISVTVTTNASAGIRYDYYMLVHSEVDGQDYYDLYKKK